MKLENEIKEKLCKITGIFFRLQYNYSVIGAIATLLHGVNLTRITRDIDFSILLDGNWEDFEKLKQVFENEGFQSTRIAHRMKTADGFVIDLLPVGGGIVENDSIRWPDGVVMSANGLREAVENANVVDIGECRVPVAPLPVIVLLKLFAYDDQGDLKHIKDILRCFEFYDRERRFELLAEEIDGLTYENAGAFLVGKDLGLLIDENQKTLVRSFIAKLEEKVLYDDEELELIAFFKYGLNGRIIRS